MHWKQVSGWTFLAAPPSPPPTHEDGKAGSEGYSHGLVIRTQWAPASSSNPSNFCADHNSLYMEGSRRSGCIFGEHTDWAVYVKLCLWIRWDLRFCVGMFWCLGVVLRLIRARNLVWGRTREAWLAPGRAVPVARAQGDGAQRARTMYIYFFCSCVVVSLYVELFPQYFRGKGREK